MLDRDSNRDPDRYWANSVHVSHNGNSSDDTGDPTNLGDGSLCRIFWCVSKQIRLVPVNKALSTAANRLYKYIATTGITYINDTHIEELDSVQKFIEIGWLLLRFFICLHKQLSYFNSVIVQVSEKHDSSSWQ